MLLGTLKELQTWQGARTSPGRIFWEVVAAPEDGDEPESFFITLNPDDQLKSGVPFSLTIYAGVMFK